jgi:hypothetical protein
MSDDGIETLGGHYKGDDMSDTPRTDEACRAEHDGSPSQWVMSDFARQLERELNAAKERIEEMVASNHWRIEAPAIHPMDRKYPTSEPIATPTSQGSHE